MAPILPHTEIMLFASQPPIQPVEYKIVEIRRQSAFAGRLGQRISEDLVIERDGTQVLVHVAGSYHTLCVREGSRLHVGETVSIRGELAGDRTTVTREQIRKVKS